MKERGTALLRRTGMSLPTKRLMSAIALVVAMVGGLSLGFLIVRLLSNFTAG